MTRNLTGAHALTLKNPWAALIAHGGKTVENRTWAPHQAVDKLLIHAGKGWDSTGVARLAETGLAMTAVVTSAIVAVADLAHVCDAARRTATASCRCGDWAEPGCWHWNLINVVVLPEPVAAAGRQGLWRPDASTLDAVREQLAAVPS